MRLLAAIPLLIAVAAFGEEVPNSLPESVAEQPVTTTPYRFEMASADPVAHGERLSAVLGCIGCHTPDLTGEDWTEPELGVLWTANLTRSAAAFTYGHAVVSFLGPAPRRSCCTRQLLEVTASKRRAASRTDHRPYAG